MPVSKDTVTQGIAEDFLTLNSIEFERIAVDLVELTTEKKLYRKGRTLKGQTRSIAVDGVDRLEKIVAEASVYGGYFESRKTPGKNKLTLSIKIQGDIAHALDQHPSCERIYLCSTQTMTRNGLGYIRAQVEEGWGQEVADRLVIWDLEMLALQMYDLLIVRPTCAGYFTTEIPSIRRIALAVAPPRPSRNYVHRLLLEQQVLTHLQDKVKAVTGLVGVSGSGKSEISKCIVQESHKEWDNVVWLTHEGVSTPGTLYSAKSANTNEHISLANIVADKKSRTLVVLDGIPEDPRGFIEHFLQVRGANARLLITSEVAYSSMKNSGHIEVIGDLSLERVLELFDRICGDSDNSELARLVCQSAGAIPSLVVLLGEMIHAKDMTRSDVLRELPSLHEMLDPSGRTLQRGLLEKHGDVVGCAVSVIAYLGSRVVEQHVFRSLLPSATVWSALKNRSLVVDEGNGLYTVNAILFHHSIAIGTGDGDAFDHEFIRYLAANCASRPAHLFQNLRLLENKVRSLFIAQPGLNIVTRAYLEIEDSKPDDEALVVLRDLTDNIPPLDESIAVECWFEIVERLGIRLSGNEVDEFYSSVIPLAESIWKASKTPYSRFHLGKLYAWSGKKVDAREIFVALWQDRSVTEPTFRSKIGMQLVSLGEHSIPNMNGGEMRAILEEVLTSESSSIRMKLGALERTRLHADTRPMIVENIDFLNETLEYYLSPTFVQPLEVVSWIMSKLSWEDPDLAVQLCDGVRWDIVETAEPSLRWRIGEIMVKFAKRKGASPEVKGADLQRAITLLSEVVPSSGRYRFYVEALYLAGDQAGVEEALASVTDEDMDPFFHHLCAKIALGNGDTSAVLFHISQGRGKMSATQLEKFGHLFTDLENKMPRV